MSVAGLRMQIGLRVCGLRKWKINQLNRRKKLESPQTAHAIGFKNQIVADNENVFRLRLRGQ